MHTGYSKATNSAHIYDGRLVGSLSDGFLASLKHTLAVKQKKALENILKFKNWGPPYYKFKKTFNGSNAPAKTLGDLTPEKK